VAIFLPSIVAVGIIWQFTQARNEFLFAVILTNQSHWRVRVALNNLAASLSSSLDGYSAERITS